MMVRRHIFPGIGYLSAALILSCCARGPSDPGNQETTPSTFGQIDWTYGSYAECAAIDADGNLICGQQYDLIAISTEGSEVWRLEDVNMVRGPVIGADGSIYITTADSTILALNADSSERWRLKVDHYPSNPPAVDADGYLYYTSRFGALYKVKPDGTPEWIAQITTLDGWSHSSPVLDSDGTIYVIFDSLYAINPDGEILWSYGEWISTRSPAIGSDGTIYLVAYHNRSFLQAVNPGGSLKWEHQLVASTDSGPVIGPEGNIYLPIEDGNGVSFLYAWDGNGQILWMFPTDDGSHSTPAVGDDGVVYFGTGDPWTDWETHWRGSSINAVNPDGTLQWRIETQRPVFASPAIGTDGHIYIHADGLLQAITCSSGGLADSAWPKFRGNSGNTGSK